MLTKIRPCLMALATVGAFSVAIADPSNLRDAECQNWTRQAIEHPWVGCETVCLQAKRFDKYNYHAGLLAAHKNRAGLDGFVRYTARSTIIGAGAEEQACHLYSLLLKWGDEPFAESVSRAGRKARVAVVDLLDYAVVTDFSKRFPRTYGLVTKHDG